MNKLKCDKWKVVTCVFSIHRSNPKYKDSPPEALFVNVLGLFLVVFGALILWIVTRPSWKRPSEQLSHFLHTSEGGGDSVTVGPSLSQLSEGTDDGDVRRRGYRPDDQDKIQNN